MIKALVLSFLCLITLSLYSQEKEFRVMSYNIRLPNPEDGINYWDSRRPLVISTIRYHHPDIIGVQEAFRRQLDEMISDMPEFDWYGVCRTDGTVKPNPDGEFSAILFRKDRFDILKGGTFWLSETPDVRGSKSWDAAYPRIVTWATFIDKNTKMIFTYFNTHFDHLGEKARAESAKLLLTRMHDIAGNMPVILSGDFNCTPTSTPYQLLTDSTAEFHVTDALLDSKIPHHGPLGSFSGKFVLPGVGENRIDFIFTRNHFTVLRHTIVSDSWDGRLPSDHLPVLAEVRIE